MKKKLFSLLTLVLLGMSSAWAETNTIGLKQDNDNTPKDSYAGTLAAATYTGATNLTVAEAHGAGCGINQSGRKTTKDGTDYYAEKCFRKTVKSSDWDATEWVGYTMTVATGYKVSLSNIQATLWDANSSATYTWRVVIESPSGSALYTSESQSTSTSSCAVLSVATPAGLANLTAGTYTVKLQLYQNGGNKYFTVPYLTVDALVEEDMSTIYTITANIADGQESFGLIDKSGNNDVVENGSISLTATPAAGYAFDSWSKNSDDSWSSEDNPLHIADVTADETYTAHFVKLYAVTFDLSSYNGTITGKTLNQYNESRGINEVYADKDGKYLIPSYASKYIYNEGYVFNKWEDGDGNQYDNGETIVISKDITLVPTWTATAQSLSRSIANTAVTWNFAKAGILFNDWQSSNFGYFTETVNVNEGEISVPMKIANGKVSNWSRDDAKAQTNKGTTFTVPAIKGMIITISNANTEFSTTTIAGSTDYTKSNSGKTIEYTYNGSDATIDIVIQENNQYIESIKVTYPKTMTYIDVTSAGYRTFASSSALDFSETIEGLKAYKAVATGSNIKFEEIDCAVPAATGMLIKAAEGRYYIPLAAGTPAAIDNALVGVTAATEKEAGIYVLMNGAQGLGFYKTTAAFTVGANTAYLPADVAGARTFIGFNDDETTGIESMNIEHSTLNAEHYYDLQGRRVAQPTKGLYILNGKKVFVN